MDEGKDRVEFMLMMAKLENEPLTLDRYVQPPQAVYSRAILWAETSPTGTRLPTETGGSRPR